MVHLKDIIEAVKTHPEAGELRRALALTSGLTKQEISRALTAYVKSKDIVRLSYGEGAYYFITPAHGLNTTSHLVGALINTVTKPQ